MANFDIDAIDCNEQFEWTFDETDINEPDALFDHAYDSLFQLPEMVAVNNDDKLKTLHQEDIFHLIQHDKSYSLILETYTDNIKNSLEFKVEAKKYFFYFSLFVLISCTVLMFGIIAETCCMLYYDTLTAKVVDILAIVVLPCVLTFLSVFIVIPRIIASYLFNKNEEDSLSEIIKNMQKNDQKIRKFLDKK